MIITGKVSSSISVVSFMSAALYTVLESIMSHVLWKMKSQL